MKVVGITGPIASGKSTVSGLLKEKGASIIDADLIAREAIKPETPAWKEIVAHFGKAILQSDKSIDRRKLGMIVFNNPSEMAFLNRAIHPRVIAEIESGLEAIERRYGDGKVVVIDVPLLFETGLNKLSDITVVVNAEEEIRLGRLISKGVPKDEAKQRIIAQKGKEVFEKLANIVIENNGTPEELERKVDELWERIRNTG